MQNIEEIYKIHSKTIYKYLFCLTGNKDIAEDLTQETFAIAVKEIYKFKGDCKISVWLIQIAKHLWYKELKKSSNKDISIENIELEELKTTEDIILKNEEKLELFKKMQTLDDKTKEVMYLRLYGNLNFIEIAEVLGKTPNWARVTFYRGKQKIREVLENE